MPSVGGLWNREDFGVSRAKTISHFGAIICSPGRHIIKLFKTTFHGKLKK